MRLTTLILQFLFFTNLCFAVGSPRLADGLDNSATGQLNCFSEATEYYQDFARLLGNSFMYYASLNLVQNINLDDFSNLSWQQKFEIESLQSNSIIFTGWSFQDANGSSIEPDSDYHLILVDKKNCHRVNIYHYQTESGGAG